MIMVLCGQVFDRAKWAQKFFLELSAVAEGALCPKEPEPLPFVLDHAASKDEFLPPTPYIDIAPVFLFYWQLVMTWHLVLEALC